MTNDSPLWQAVFEHAPDAMILVDTSGTVLEANHQSEILFGYRRAELVGQSVECLLSAPLRERHVQHRAAYFANPNLRPMGSGLELYCQPRQGDPFPIEVSLSPLEIDGALLVLAVIRDISASKRMQAALAESERRYRTVVENARDIIYRTDVNGQFTYYNATVTRVLGYDATELLGRPYLDLIAPASRLEARRFYRQQFVERQPNSYYEFPARTKDGQERWLGQNVQPLWEQDRIVGFQAVARDITARKHAQQALQSNEQQYRTLWMLAQEQMCERDLFDRIRDLLAGETGLETLLQTIVAATADTFGYTHVSLYLRQGEWLVLQHQVGYARVVPRIALAQGISGRVARTGIPVWLPDISADPEFVAAQDGITSEVCVPLLARQQVVGIFNIESTRGMVLTADDLRRAQALSQHIGIALERSRLYSSLRESEETFASAFTHAAIGIALVAPDGRWLKVNQAVCDLVGYSAEEMLTKTFQDTTHPDDLDLDLAYVRQMLAGEITTYQMEKRYLHRSGAIVWVLLSVSLVRDAQGQPRYFISQIQDIRERKRVEEALRRQNAELGALSQLGHALSRLAQPEELLEVLYRVSGQILDNRNLYIALYDEPNQTITFPIYTIDGQRISRPERRFSNGLTEHVIRTRTALLLPRGVEKMARTLGIEPRGRPSHCFLAVPMLVGEKVLGVIAIQDYEREAVYDHGHREVLQTIAAQAAIALENARLFTETEQLARTDPLTGLANRRYLFEVGAHELSRARRFGHPLSVVMLDIDHFKRINDRYGHATGDQVLQGLARLCQKHVRDIDLVGRYGGEELVILLVETDLAGARASAERLRAQIAGAPIETDAGPLQVTASLGLAEAQVESDGFATLVVRADSALYASKQAGRDRVAG